MSAPPFIPTQFEIATSDGNQFARLVFEDDNGRRQELLIREGPLAALAQQIQSRIAPGSATPLAPELLHAGQLVETETFQVQPAPNGGSVLILHLRLPPDNRIVTLPLNLSAELRAALVAMLTTA